MLSAAERQAIRRLHLEEGLPIKQIAQSTGRARNTVRAVLRIEGLPTRNAAALDDDATIDLREDRSGDDEEREPRSGGSKLTPSVVEDDCTRSDVAQSGDEMARTIETIVHLEDDISGGAAAETIQFSFEGRSYEIDLSKANARKFRAAMKPYLDHARRAGSGARKPRQAPARRTGGAVDSQAIRAWAVAKKLKVPSRGRLPATIIDEYNAAHR